MWYQSRLCKGEATMGACFLVCWWVKVKGCCWVKIQNRILSQSPLDLHIHTCLNNHQDLKSQARFNVFLGFAIWNDDLLDIELTYNQTRTCVHGICFKPEVHTKLILVVRFVFWHNLHVFVLISSLRYTLYVTVMPTKDLFVNG